MDQTLTNIEDLRYLLTIQQTEVKKMVGTIRTKEKCPVCQGPFAHIPKLGFLCGDHKTIPQKVYIDLSWQGKRVRVFSDKQGQVLDSYQRALNLLAKINYEIENHIFDPSRYIATDQKHFTFDYLISKWIKEKERQAEKNNLAFSYVDKLKIYSEKYIRSFFKGKDIRDIRTVDIKDFYHQLPQRISAKYTKNIVNALENFFNVLVSDEVIERKPIFPSITVPEQGVSWCDRETQDKIIEAIPEKHRPIFFFLTRQGLRPGEAAVLKWKDLNLVEGTITPKRTLSNRKILERTKGKTVRPRLLHPDLLDRISSLPKGFPESFLFVHPNNKKPYQVYTLNRIWNRACELVGVHVKLYEATRHSVASMAASSGVSLNIISEVLGHSDIRTTMKYAHLDVLAQNQVFSAQVSPRLSPDRHQGVKFEKNS
jgi:integrase